MSSQDPIPPGLVLTIPPSLHPSWLAHIPSLPPPTTSTSPTIRKQVYRENCLTQNTHLLSTTLSHLTQNLHITDSTIPSSPTSTPPHCIPTRLYNPTSLLSAPASQSSPDTEPLIIYIHGGGLFVGDLDTEDLTCRLLALSLHLPLLSISYRKLPEHTADDAVSDALDAFDHLSSVYPKRQFILVGSSSGGQLAATIALLRGHEGRIQGVVLRCPVTCDATDGGARVPEEWKGLHRSMREEFETGILKGPAVTRENRVKIYKMPLDMLAELPKRKGTTELRNEEEPASEKLEEIKWFIQLCTNDIYYSDGMCLGIGLRERGAQVRIRVETSWPHTFWLKGMVLEEARTAEEKVVEGLQWILKKDNENDGQSNIRGRGEDWVEWSEEIKD